MTKQILEKFKKICTKAIETGDVEGEDKSVKQLIRSIIREHKRVNHQTENYDVFDHIYLKKPKTNVHYESELPKHDGKILVFLGKPYKVRGVNAGNAGHIEFFPLSQYNVHVTYEDTIKQAPIFEFEETLKNSFPIAKAFFVLHTNELSPTDKDKIKYRTYDEILNIGKGLYGIDKRATFNPEISSKENYNTLVSVFGDSICKISSSFKHCSKK